MEPVFIYPVSYSVAPICLEQLRGLESSVTLKSMNAKIRRVFNSNFIAVKEALEGICRYFIKNADELLEWKYGTKMPPIVEDESKTFFFETKGAHRLCAKRLLDCYYSLRALGVRSEKKYDLIPVGLLFSLEGLAKAINDFNEFNCVLSDRYPNIIPADKFTDISVVFSDESYRSYEIAKDFNRHYQLLTRIINVFECGHHISPLNPSYRNKPEAPAPKLEWIEPDAPLYLRPEYSGCYNLYVGDEGVSYHRSKSRNKSSGGFNSLNRDDMLYTCDLYGRSVFFVTQYLKDYVEHNGLNINIQPIELVKQTLHKNCLPYLRKFFTDNSTIYDIKKLYDSYSSDNESKNYSKDSALPVHKALFNILSQVKSEDILSYIDKASKGEELDPRTTRILAESFRGITTFNIEDYYVAITGYKGYSHGRYINILNGEVKALAGFIFFAVRAYDSRLRGAVAMKGCKEGSTLCIFHFNNRVLFDACIE